MIVKLWCDYCNNEYELVFIKFPIATVKPKICPRCVSLQKTRRSRMDEQNAREAEQKTRRSRMDDINIQSSVPSDLGYVYILKNEFMPGLVKIGFTTRTVSKRIQELSSATGSPGKFLEIRSWEVYNPHEIEQKILSALKQYRTDGEFFNLSEDKCLKKVTSILQVLNEIDENGRTIPHKERVRKAFLTLSL